MRVSCTSVQDPYDQIQIVDLSKDATGHLCGKALQKMSSEWSDQ
jgi:hypothetical protein